MGTTKNQLTNKQLAEALASLLEQNIELQKEIRTEQSAINKNFIEELKTVDLKPNTGDLKELYQSYNKILTKSRDEISELLNAFKYAKKLFFYSIVIMVFCCIAICGTAWFFREVIFNRPTSPPQEEISLIEPIKTTKK